MKTALSLLPVALLSVGCAVAQPFAGPGWDPDEGLTADVEGPIIVTATYAKIASGEKRAFNDHVDRIAESLDAGPEGLIGYSLRGELAGDEVWTVSAWEDEDALMWFIASEAHLAAMQEVSTLTEDAHFARWEEPEPAALVIDWDDIEARLESDD